MGKYLITGRQGSGKTTVIAALQSLGYKAYNTDDIAGATKLQNKITGQTIEWPKGKVDWAEYAWNWQKPVIEELLSSDKDVFLGAVVSNQEDFYDTFDKVFLIEVSENTLRKRLASHEHESHHLPGEIERILSGHADKQCLMKRKGVTSVSGENTPEQIAQEILSECKLLPR